MTDRMHILVLSEDFYPTISGGAHAQWRFAQLAAERGHEVTVFTKRLPGADAVERVDGVEIRRPHRAQPSRLPPNHPLAFATRICYSVYLAVALVAWQQRRDADVVVSVSQLFHWVGSVLSLVADIDHASFIGYTPSLKSTFRMRPDFLLERLNFALFVGDLVFCRTPRVRSLVERHTADVQVIHGVVNRERVEAVTGSSGQATADRRSAAGDGGGEVLAFVGRLTPLKRPVAALDVVQQLPSRFGLVFVGDGPMRDELEREIRRRDLTDRVRCLGTRSHAQTLEIIATSAGLLLPSRAEAYPTVVFEALSVCTPVFATPVGILPSLTETRLHLGTTDELPPIVVSNVDQAMTGLDGDVLQRYSMETYAETMLEGIHDLRA